MPEQDEQKLDATLAEYFRGALDGQRGRSEAAFRQYLRGESKLAWRTRSFLIGAFGAGLAASVAVLWASPMFHASSAVRTVADGPTNHIDASLVLPVVERVVDSRTSDEGVIMLDDETPVRVLRRQSIEQTRYYDEHDTIQSQEVTPRDDLVLMKLTTY